MHTINETETMRTTERNRIETLRSDDESITEARVPSPL